jgi:hypothetical protein
MSLKWAVFRNCALAMTLAAGLGWAAAAADRADVAGNWIFQAQAGIAGRGARETVDTDGMVVQANGGKIKGTLSLPRGGSSPLEGTVSGNEVHFIVKRQTPEGEVDVEYKGVVDGDSMKGTYRVVGQATGTDIHWVAQRQK